MVERCIQASYSNEGGGDTRIDEEDVRDVCIDDCA